MNLRIRDCQLDSEEAPVVVRSQSNVTFASVRFEDNVNQQGSAAISANQASTVTIQDSSFLGNAGRTASAVRAGRDCRVEIAGSEFEFQSGRNSTLVLMNARSLTISDSTFRNNTARRQAGGAINIMVTPLVRHYSYHLCVPEYGWHDRCAVSAGNDL